ncbi:MAG: HAD family hydrolase [Mangrovibacterium sp.]
MLLNDIPKGIKGFIFDFDGTLCDTMPIHYIAWKNAVSPYGINFTTELFDTLAGIPVYETIEELNLRFGTRMDAKSVGDKKEAEYAKSMHMVCPIEPVLDVVKHFHGNIPMTVGTGGWRSLTESVLKQCNMMSYFDAIVTSEDVKKHKPHPETFLKCAEIMQIAPKDCLVFEDGILGMQAAEACGMKWIDVRNYYEVTIGKE